MQSKFLSAALAAALSTSASAAAPSFDCAKVDAGSIEALVCQSEELSKLDRRLAETYAAASVKAKNEHPATLKPSQRGWVKGRNDCWKADDKNQCISASYRLRIAELQARYRLVAHTGPVRFQCNGNPADEVIATYFQSDTPTLIAERGDSTSLMYQQASASGSRYQGRNESLWEHQSETLITWGYGAPEMRCKKAG